MPTAQSVAIREETAIERVRQAAVTLKQRTGADFKDVDLNFRMAPIERQAVTLEQVADILESLVLVLQDPVMLDEAPEAEEKEEADNGSTEQGKRRPNPRRKT